MSHLEHAAFDPAKYTDEVKARVAKLLADKAKHGATIEAPQTERAPAIPDLMEALRASLSASAGHAKPAKKRRRHAA